MEYPCIGTGRFSFVQMKSLGSKTDPPPGDIILCRRIAKSLENVLVINHCQECILNLHGSSLGQGEKVCRNVIPQIINSQKHIKSSHIKPLAGMHYKLIWSILGTWRFNVGQIKSLGSQMAHPKRAVLFRHI